MQDNNQRYRITIKNWDEYQREMRGGEKRRRRRDWVAISTNIYRDPDFLNMTAETRLCWVMLLCHAGNVGPVFELCPSDARVLFQLRKSPDFEVLKNQGFIDLEAATGHDNTDNTRQDTSVTKKTKAKKKTASKPKPDKTKAEALAEERLNELKAGYPARAGGSTWPRAMRAANARMKEGATWQEIMDGVRRYALFCGATNRINTTYVKDAATFCGPDLHFRNPWDLPASAAQSRTDKNLSAVQQALLDSEEDDHERE